MDLYAFLQTTNGLIFGLAVIVAVCFILWLFIGSW